MNAVDMYFINKANSAVEDEYFPKLLDADITNLEKAKRRILYIPFVTLGVTYMIKSFRDHMFVSNNFLVNMMTVRGKYRDTKFRSKNYQQRKSQVDKLADPYKEIVIEQKLKKEESIKQDKTHAAVAEKPFKQNPDPFQRRMKMKGFTPATKTFTGSQKHVDYENPKGEQHGGPRGNQIMSKGSFYTSMLRTHTDYEQNERFNKSVLNSEELEAKREKRFRFFKKVKLTS